MDKLHEQIFAIGQKLIKDVDRGELAGRTILPSLSDEEYLTLILALGAAAGMFFEQDRDQRRGGGGK